MYTNLTITIISGPQHGHCLYLYTLKRSVGRLCILPYLAHIYHLNCPNVHKYSIEDLRMAKKWPRHFWSKHQLLLVGVHTYTAIYSIHSNLDQYNYLGTNIHDQPPKMMKQWSNKLRERAVWATHRRNIRSFTKNHPISESVILGLRKKIPWIWNHLWLNPRAKSIFFDQRKKKKCKKNTSSFPAPHGDGQFCWVNFWLVPKITSRCHEEKQTNGHLQCSKQNRQLARQEAHRNWRCGKFWGENFPPKAGAQGKNHWVNNFSVFLFSRGGWFGAT